MPSAHPPSARRLCLTLDAIVPLGRVLVRTGRVHLVELSAAELGELARAHGASGIDPPAGTARGPWWWAPGATPPTDLPELTQDEALAVSAAELAALSGNARTLDGADWDDPRARPPDPPG